MPALDEATAAMTKAGDALAAGQTAPALTAQRDALIAMSRAIELFLQLRQLIDVTLGEEREVVKALTPPAEGAAAMTAAERAKVVGEGTTRNRDRLLRMQGLIAAEKANAIAQAEAQAQQAAQGGQGGQPPAADPNAGALYDQLEALRAQAATALDEVAAVAAGGKGAALTSAQTGEARLVEMQKLLFSVIEHLQELIREQGETRDQTAKTELEDDAGRVPLLPGLIQRQGEHAQMADAIAQALARQADAASQGGGGGGATGGAVTPQAMAEAAGEVRNGRTSMQNAGDTLTKARDQSGAMSYNLQPVLEDQQQAKEHLENALRLLAPPKQQNGGDNDQDSKGGDQKSDPSKQDPSKQDPQKQDPQKPDPQQDQQGDPQQDQQGDPQQQTPDQKQSADDAERRLQRVREREAQRQREQQQRQRPANEPVERDW